MKLFFEVCKEFFDLLYLPFVSDIIEKEIIGEKYNENLDEEKGYQEASYIEDENYIQEKQDVEKNNNQEEDFCSCDFFRQMVSFINSRIYKQLNNNKSE
jgi:hypothetical protein